MRALVRTALRGAVSWLGLSGLVRHIRADRPIGFLVSRFIHGESYSCLESSLAEIGMRSRKNQTALLAIGVKKEKGRFLAHAWVEADGESFDEREGFKKIGTI